VVAFAEADDVAARLNRVLTEEESAWVVVLLEDASAYLREVIGQQVCPVTQSEFVAYPDAGRVDLPQWPVVSVDVVERDTVAVDYTYRPGYITVGSDDPVDVTFTWGCVEVPPLLKALACVLVSQSILAVETTGSLSFGGLSSIALDDFRAAFSNGGAESGMVLPKVQQSLIRARFGQGDLAVVESR